MNIYKFSSKAFFIFHIKVFISFAFSDFTIIFQQVSMYHFAKSVYIYRYTYTYTIYLSIYNLSLYLYNKLICRFITRYFLKFYSYIPSRSHYILFIKKSRKKYNLNVCM